MPSLSFFVDEHDLRLIVDRLNADPEIAFIVPDHLLAPEIWTPNQPPRSSRPVVQLQVPASNVMNMEMKHSHRQRWKAVRAVDALKDGEHGLWHVSAGLCL